jgi:hypothetical protein
MTDPVTPARQVIEFARGVLSIELEHWQAEALEGLITSYGTACVMLSRGDDQAAAPATDPAISGISSWQPHPTGQVPGQPAGTLYRRTTNDEEDPRLLRSNQPHPAALRRDEPPEAAPLAESPGPVPSRHDQMAARVHEAVRGAGDDSVQDLREEWAEHAPGREDEFERMVSTAQAWGRPVPSSGTHALTEALPVQERDDR